MYQIFAFLSHRTATKSQSKGKRRCIVCAKLGFEINSTGPFRGEKRLRRCCVETRGFSRTKIEASNVRTCACAQVWRSDNPPIVLTEIQIIAIKEIEGERRRGKIAQNTVVHPRTRVLCVELSRTIRRLRVAIQSNSRPPILIESESDNAQLVRFVKCHSCGYNFTGYL